MTHYYILFENYEQGLALHDLLDGAGVDNRIAPAPASVRIKHGCGMSLVLSPDDVDRAKRVITEHEAPFYDIVPVENQIRAGRDRYC